MHFSSAYVVGFLLYCVSRALPVGIQGKNYIFSSFFPTGKQVMAVVCMDRRKQNEVADENCEALDKPKEKSIKCNNKPCPAR